MGIRSLAVLGLGLALLVAEPAAAQGECIWGDCWNGHGTRRNADGSFESGTWKDGKLVRTRTRTKAPSPRKADAEPRAERRDPRPGNGCLRGDCMDGTGLRTYPDGSNYEGQFHYGLRHGQGKQTHPDGSSYQGAWQHDKPHGQGLRQWRHGRYEGRFEQGQPTRDGRYLGTNGDVYVGDWLQELRHGHGTLSRANGDRYTGEFRGGEIHGVGTYAHADGRIREGRFAQGRFMGAGPASASSGRPGAVGVGGCVSGDCTSGRGVYAYPDGRTYKGEFHAGLPHGRGSITHPDGRVEAGRFDRGRRVSRSVIAEPPPSSRWNGRRSASTGCTKGDCRSGRGTWQFADGSTYTGEFRGGKQNGHGIWRHPGGKSYIGQWREGRRHGEGTLTHPDGTVQQGRWVNGELGGRASLHAARHWPDLSRPGRRIGGGGNDAAVVVGIERYAHVARIDGAGDNATAWYDWLIRARGVPVDAVQLLLDQDATVEDMRWAVETASARVGEGGTLWFVFVGHGAPAKDREDGLLVGFDAQQKARSIHVRSFRRSELLASLEGSRAGRIQVFLDACFSGRSGSGAQLVAGLQPLVVTTGDPVGDGRTTLMTAARNDEFAGPLPGGGRPAFSYLALGGLRGWADGDGDGQVTGVELRGYVDRVLRALVRDRSQRATVAGDGGSPLARSGRERGPDLGRLRVELARSGGS